MSSNHRSALCWTPVILAVLAALAGVARADDSLWLTNFDAAKAKAKAEKKLLLVDFTGSDWCGWCIRLKNEVFDKDLFKSEAPKRFVLVELDYPRQKKLPDDLKDQNAKLAKQYKVHGYPTIMLMDADGQAVGRTGYRPDGPAPYMKHLGEMVTVYEGLPALRAELQKAKGLDRAKVLDRLVESYVTLNNEIDELEAWSKEIVSLDAENKAGLKTKYEVRLLMAAATELKAKRQIAEAKAALDKLLALPGLSAQQKQDALFAQGECFFYEKDYRGVVACLKQAVAANPTGDRAKVIEGMLKRFTPMAEAQEAVAKLQAEAEKAQGVERAKVLDQLIVALSKIGNKMGDKDLSSKIPEWSKEIRTLDAYNKAGLKNKYEFRHLVAQVPRLRANDQFAEAHAVLDKALALPGLQGEQIQEANMRKADLHLARQESQQALACLKKALDAAPEGQQATYVKYMLERTQRELEKQKPKETPKKEGAQRGAKPNVVVILTDDQGWGDLSINGNTNLSTPNIDSLAGSGAMFDRFFVCPVCSPTRAEFLTGRYHPRGGVYSTSTGGERLNLAEKTIADTFHAGGYATAAFGKWHNGMQYPYHPRARGFDEFYGFCSGHWGDYFDALLEHNGQLVQGKGFLIDDLTDHAMQWIEQHKDRPFFCYVPFNTPHTPAQVPDRFFAKFANYEPKLRDRDDREELGKTRAVLAMCENIDWNVGRLLKKLDDLKLADNTIVIYFCDNGPNGRRWNGGMRGRKGSVDEGGVRSPMLIRWPGRIQGGKKIAEIAGAIDLLPTLADMAGIPVVGAKPLDGKSLKPLLLGTAADWPERMIYSHWAGKVSLRTQRYRFVAPNQLFDMVADPGQDRNIAKDKSDVAKRLGEALQQWKAEVLPDLGKQNWPFTVGYRAFPITQLPARDGVPHGNVQRSAKAPNSSYFTNWTSKDDSITWDVEVATAGKYEAVVYYACPKADVGSTIELSLNKSRLEARVSEPHDPPLRGQEHDRIPRESESYVKDFKPMRFGVIDLPAGRGQLTLKALQVPGKQVMEVRLILLTLLN